jgi:RNA polymerase sigma-70 factor (ECF subfamily)
MPRRRTDSGIRADMTPSLIVSLRAGESEAGALLDHLYREKMIRFCAGYLGNLEEAEDAVQDVFCKILESSAIPDNFRAWLYKITRNRCLDILRSRGRCRDDAALPSESHLGDDLTGSLTKLVRRELHAKLRELVAALPIAQREVLRLRYTEGLSRAEIAEVLEIPEKLVKSRLYDGLERLRKQGVLAADH